MTTTSPSIPDIESVRRLYPGLETDTVLLENAGGSQVPLFVADAIRDHLLHDYVQLGAGYPASDRATATVERAPRSHTAAHRPCSCTFASCLRSYPCGHWPWLRK